MRAPDWYPAWREDALLELVAKREEAKLAYKVGDWPRFDYDAHAGTLIFSEKGVPQVVSEIQIVGTTNGVNWLWSWANPHWDGARIEEMSKVREFGLEHGIEELTTDYLEADDINALGWEVTAVAARILDAAGAYRPPQGDSAVFLVCKSFGFMS